MREDKDMKDSLEKQAIDKYYGELNSELNSDELESIQEFTRKFDKFTSKLSELEPPSEEMDINIMEIILEGEQIREKNENKKETLAFIGVCMFIISLITGITLIVGARFFLYFQAAAFLLMTVSLIATVLIAKKGRKLNEH